MDRPRELVGARSGVDDADRRDAGCEDDGRTGADDGDEDRTGVDFGGDDWEDDGIGDGDLDHDYESGDFDGVDREDPRYRAGVERRVLDGSTTLMGAEPDEVDTKIEWTLGTTAEYVGADRCRVFRHDPDTDAFDPTHQWTAPGVEPCDRSIDADSDGALRRLVARLDRFENVRVDRAAALGADPARDEAGRPAADVGSFVAVPLVDAWELTGVLTFEILGADRGWADHEVRTLRTLADVVAHTLARRRRIRELRRRNAQLDEFASTVSHDLRNPLNVAGGFLSLVRETGDLSHLDRVERAFDRMELLVDDLLSLAKQGRTVGETTSVDLADATRRSWGDVDTGDATLTVDSDLGRVRADEPRLEMVFENLFRNAVEHAGCAVAVRVGSLADGAGFFVADDGDGVDPENRSRVFERGHTGSDSGTGFGLAIVSRVVGAHGWSVGVAESESGGARFEIRTDD